MGVREGGALKLSASGLTLSARGSHNDFVGREPDRADAADTRA